MSHYINPLVDTSVATQLSDDVFWFKEKILTNQIHTKEEGDKRVFKDSSVYVIYNIVNNSNYFILVNDKHELLFDTSSFDKMAIQIEKMKTVD